MRECHKIYGVTNEKTKTRIDDVLKCSPQLNKKKKKINNTTLDGVMKNSRILLKARDLENGKRRMEKYVFRKKIPCSIGCQGKK